MSAKHGWIAVGLASFVGLMALSSQAIIKDIRAENDKPATTPTPVVTTVATPSSTPVPTVTPKRPVWELEEPGVETRVIKFGQTYQWDDGLRMTVSKPKEFVPDPTVVRKYKHYVSFTVTINPTARNAELQYMVDTVYAGDKNAHFVATEGNGWPGGVRRTGEPMTFMVSYGYDVPGKLAMKVNPLFDSQIPDIRLYENVVWA